MKTSTLIELIEKAEIGDRRLDKKFAAAIGWQSHYGYQDNPNTGQRETIVVWIDPKTGFESRIPQYTTSLEDSKEAAEAVFSQEAVAVSWGKGNATAAFSDAKVRATAATPALALCSAILRAMG